MCCNFMTGVSYAFIMTDALSVDLEGGLASRDRCMSLFFWSVSGIMAKAISEGMLIFVDGSVR